MGVAVAAGHFELHRQYDGHPGGADRHIECHVIGAGLGKQHIIADGARAGRRQLRDGAGMDPAWPWPGADASEAGVVDADDDDGVGRRRRVCGDDQVVDDMIEPPHRAGQHQRHEQRAESDADRQLFAEQPRRAL